MSKDSRFIAEKSKENGIVKNISILLRGILLVELML